MAKTIVFFSPMCPLDHTSGAAVGVRSILEALAARGWTALSFSMSVFDSQAPLALGDILGPEATKPDNRGKLLVIRREGVTHHVFLTGGTRGGDVTRPEMERFRAVWEQWIAERQPEAILSFGSSAYSKTLQDIARRHCKRFIFYLANAEFTDPTYFAETDCVVVTSPYTQQYYRDTLGLNTQVVPPIIKPERFVAEDDAEAITSQPALRRVGFVTFINPIPHKGLTMILRLVALARTRRPDMRFLVLAGRMDRATLRSWNADLGAYPNVWWIDAQADMKAVYRRTAILLYPSFWKEAFARSLPEAQLSGIPVIASRRGGIPITLNGGGVLLDVPEACIKNHVALPGPDQVAPWWEALDRLWTDDAAYGDLSRKAREAARPYHPQAGGEALARFMEAQTA